MSQRTAVVRVSGPGGQGDACLRPQRRPCPCPAGGPPLPFRVPLGVPLLGKWSAEILWHYQKTAASYFRVVCQEGSDALLLRGGSRDISSDQLELPFIAHAHLAHQCWAPWAGLAGWLAGWLVSGPHRNSQLNRYHSTCLSTRRLISQGAHAMGCPPSHPFLPA